MKSEYVAGFVLVGMVCFLLLSVWIPLLFISRRIQNKRLGMYDSMVSDQLERKRVLYLIDKIGKK